MAYIAEINQAQTAQEASQSNTPKTKSLTLGQDDFLTLLVAQLQNQDPLNPSDPTEFTAQLAQFSQLEQLFNLNKSVDSLTLAQNNSERLSALTLIGKEVLVTGSTFSLDQDIEQIGYNVDGSASSITINIQDSSGVQVATLTPSELTEGNHFISWNGLDKNGQRLPAGQYKVVIQAQSIGEDTSVAVSPLVRSLVTGVDLKDAGALLQTGAGEYSINDIKGVYEKKSSQDTASNESATETATPVSDLLTDTASNAADNYFQDTLGTDSANQQSVN